MTQHELFIKMFPGVSELEGQILDQIEFDLTAFDSLVRYFEIDEIDEDEVSNASFNLRQLGLVVILVPEDDEYPYPKAVAPTTIGIARWIMSDPIRRVQQFRESEAVKMLVASGVLTADLMLAPQTAETVAALAIRDAMLAERSANKNWLTPN